MSDDIVDTVLGLARLVLYFEMPLFDVDVIDESQAEFLADTEREREY